MSDSHSRTGAIVPSGPALWPQSLVRFATHVPTGAPVAGAQSLAFDAETDPSSSGLGAEASPYAPYLTPLCVLS